MTHFTLSSITRTLAALALVAGAGLAAAQSSFAVASPVRPLTIFEINALSGQMYNSLAGPSLRTAATARVSALGRNARAPVTQRRAGATAAVYVGTTDRVPPLLPTWPTNDVLEKYEPLKTGGDLGEAWATMSSTGVPYLYVTGYGAFEADATAAWATTINVPAGPSREVVLRFTIPSITVAGDTEGDHGQAYWRSRLRADLLVNGFPAWSSEAVRMTLDPFQAVSEPVVLQRFGDPLVFPTNDEDADLGNDTNIATAELPSATRTVHLTLGRVPGGTALDLSMSLRGSAMTVPQYDNGTDNRCSKDTLRYFCTRATVTVQGASWQTPAVYMLP